MSRYHNCLNRMLIVSMLWILGFSQCWASVPAGVSEYYVPVDEDNEWTILNVLGTGIAAQNMHSVISITPWSDNTVIYYDHWEDGYDFDPNNPTTADETCTANIGAIKTFESNVPLPRTTGAPVIPGQGTYVGAGGNCTGQASPASCTIGAGGNTDYCYDGRDRIVVVGGGSTVVRGGWPQTTGVVTGLAEEVYPVAPQLTTYVLPFGEDIYAANNTRVDYQRVFVTIQATENTTFQVNFDPANGNSFDALDCDHNGTTDGTLCSLNAGEIYRLDQTSDGTGGPFATLNTGAVIQGASTLQVQFLNGDPDANFNSRATSAFPRGFWDDEYYAPVVSGTTAGRNTDILLHNPNSTAITITWETRAGSGSFTIGAYQSTFFQAMTGSYVPNNSGVYLKGSGVFWGISDVDNNSDVRDWAYSLVPAYLLDDEQFLSWSPGCYDNTTGLGCAGTAGNRDDNGIFITPAQDNTTIFVDRDNNGTADYTYNLNRLQVQYVYDATDGDLTGAHIWSTGPYVLSYGENLDTSRTANPSLDAGYTTLPNPGNWMDLALTVKKATSPVVLLTTANPATTTYTLTVQSHEFDIDSVKVTDTLAYDWTYAVGTDTTTITLPNGSTLNTDPTVTAPGGALPGGGTCSAIRGSCLTWPGATLGNMAPNQTIIIVFTARSIGTPDCSAGPTPCVNGSLSQNNVTAQATRTVGGITQTFTASDSAFNVYLDNSVNMGVTKSSSVAETTPVSPGDTLTYTVNVTNPNTSASNLTGVALYDALPTGISYVAGSGSISCDLGTTANFRDNFGSVAYNNSNGSSSWTSDPWSETDSLGGGAASGLVQVTTGGQLRLGLTQNVRDEFSSAAYNLNGPNNTANWSGDWAETDSVGSGATSGVLQVVGNQLRFGPFTSATVLGTASDNFSSQNYSGGTGWANNWTENNDGTSSPTSGDIRIDNSQRIEFWDTTDGGESIQRSVTVTGATGMTIQYDFDPNNSLGNSDNLVVEYSANGGGAWTTLRTVNGSTPDNSSFTDNISWNPSDTTFILRFRAVDPISNNGEARFDNVNISYSSSTSVTAAGTQIQRTANLAGASSATFSFNYVAANLEAGDTLVVEASSDGSSFTTLETLDGTTGSGTKSYNLKSPTDYTSANTTIRFRVTGGFDAADETFSIDNVDITYGGSSAMIQRTANLTGAVTPSLTFSAAAANLEAGDTLVVEASSSASGPFTTLATYTAGTPDVVQPYSLTPYISAATTIRFRITGGYTENNETFSVDNVDIGYAGVSTFASANPPNFLASATGCQIPPGQNLTLTFNATVDNPFPTGLSEILNTVSATANEIPIPISDDARNIVVNPSQSNASVGDSVWLDNDGDGVLDPGEAGLANVEVTLKDQYGTPLQTALTDSQGHYQFNGVAAGSGYYVEVTGGLPSGLTQTTDSRTDGRTNAFNLSAGQVYSGADLGYEPASGYALVGDRVWSDADGDGVQDAGEPGLSGVKVWLYTDSNSNGKVDDNPINLIGGLLDMNGVGGITAADVGTFGGYNVITTGCSGAGGCVDINRDGTITAADNGRAGGYNVIEGKLDSSGNGLIGGEDVGPVYNYTETTTGANGIYSFNAAATGSPTYIVYVDLDQSALSAYNLTTANGTVFYSVASGGSYLTADFGVQQKTAGTTFTITDRIWLDDGNGGGTSGDGLQNGGELGLSGVTVDLLDASGNVVATTMTDGSGNFSFTGVPGGVRYSWRVTDQGNVLANYYGTTSYAQVSAYQMPGTLTADTSYTAAPHFGYNTARSIGDTVFNDSGAGGGTAGNGVQDGSEAGISGVVVKLYSDSGTLGVIDGSDAVIGTLTTDANGKYLFSGLANGNYIVSIESPPSGYTYVASGQPADSDGVTAGQQRAASIAGGVSDLDNDFGYQAGSPRTLSGKLWNDVNNNGADNGEAGLANVTVELYADADGDGIIDSGETRIGVTSSDSSGNYSFAGVPGSGTEDYIVRITDQNGVLSGYTATYEKTESTTSPFNGQESILNLNSNISDLNFGFYKPVPTYALISGFRVYTMNGQSWVEWSTLREHGTVGFFVERADPATGKWTRLNGGQMLRGLVISAQGGDYRLVDPDVAAGETHRYRLVEREAWGTERTYGPWTLKVADQESARLSRISGASATDMSPSRSEVWKSLGHNYMARAHHSVNKPVQSDTGAGPSVQRSKGLKPLASGGALAVSHNQRVRLRTGAEGLYRLDTQNLSDIAAYLGVEDIFSALSQGNMRLASGGKIAPYYYDEDNKNLYFVGSAYRTLETQENIYHLRSSIGRKMPMLKGRSPKAAAPGVFRDTQRFEENNKDLLLPWLHSEENADYWYWDYVMPPYAPAASLTLQLPEPSNSGQGILKIYLRGAGDEAAGDDRLVTASLNGVPLPGNMRWSGNREAVLQTEFDQATLGAAVNGAAEMKLQISGTPLNGAAYDLFMIDRVEVEYNRKMRAYQGAVLLRNVTRGVVGVDGFSGNKITVIENPGTSRAKWRQDVTITAAATGGFQASFIAGKTADYLLTEISKSAQIEADSPSALKAPNRASDYLIIAPRELSQGATALADYRKQVFNTEIAWLDDIYDQFSYGRPESAAIEAFLDYAFNNRTHAPRYVVLLGRGTLDHRDLLGYHESLIPLRLAATPWGLAASDNRYADVDGDKLPDYRLGRIVVSSEEEALAYVDKLIAYEAVIPGAWNLHTTLVADNPDNAGDFHANSNQIGDLLQTYTQGYTVDKLYHPLLDVRSHLLNGWNNGYGYVNYIGHGGAMQLAAEGFMTVADVANMTNGEKLPVFAALTCAVGDSTMPGILGLSDKLVQYPAGGAIAAFSPTGLSVDAQALPLNKYFVERLLDSREDIGNAALFAHQTSSAVDHIDGFMHDIYQVSGDPAVRLH